MFTDEPSAFRRRRQLAHMVRERDPKVEAALVAAKGHVLIMAEDALVAQTWATIYGLARQKWLYVGGTKVLAQSPYGLTVIRVDGWRHGGWYDVAMERECKTRKFVVIDVELRT